ncbi:MAG: hypothetical protein IPJ51_11240 [Saprospiraceae bacterium]|jgi:hypothetical protein|nr:hypothetical protein [Saprospiraceae bacterium]
MAISQSDQLFQLVKSLTKAEKRNFTFYSTRIQEADSLKYIQLFELMDKQKELNDHQILTKLKGIDKVQYSNLKRHLYKQLMTSLRMIHIQKKTDIQVREYLDYVDILYGKGLYLQSLKILDKAKILADKSNNDLLYLAILETEKNIESRHITRSGPDIVPDLIAKSEEKIKIIDSTAKLSNIRILLHSHYIKNGHVKNQDELEKFVREYQWVKDYHKKENLTYHEKIYLYQSLVWYYYIILDFENCLIYAENWVNLFQQSPDLISEDPDLYMRGYHYILTCAYNLRLKDKYDKYLDELENYRDSNYAHFNNNSQIISFLYVHYGRLNKYFLHEKYNEGLKIIPATLKRIQRYKSKLDAHRILVFYFKIAWMHLMAGDNDTAIKYLNQIFQMEVGSLREDIQGYSQLMFLMAHYDAGNYEIMEYLVKGAKMFFAKMQEKNKLQESIIKFFQKIVKLPMHDRKKYIKGFYEDLSKLEEDKFEQRSMLYLDIKPWLAGKF